MERGPILVSASRGVGESPRSAPSHSNRHLFVEGLPAHGRFRVTRLQHRSEKPSRHTLSRPMDAIIAPFPQKKLLSRPKPVLILLLPMFSRVQALHSDSLWRGGPEYRIPFATHIGGASTSCEVRSANAPRQRHCGVDHSLSCSRPTSPRLAFVGSQGLRCFLTLTFDRRI